MSEARQLTFDLGLRPALNREDFMVAPSNEVAVALMDSWPDWPASIVVLWGPPGAGKTHLSGVWRQKSAALTLDLAALDLEELRDLSEARDPVLLEDVDRALAVDASKAEVLFHLHNLLREEGRALLMTGSLPPHNWPMSLPDLRSRVTAALAVELGPPDDTLMGGVLIKLFSDRQLHIEPDVLNYIIARIERSFAAARELVAVIDEIALVQHREISIAVAREALQGLSDAISGS